MRYSILNIALPLILTGCTHQSTNTTPTSEAEDFGAAPAKSQPTFTHAMLEQVVERELNRGCLGAVEIPTTQAIESAPDTTK